MYSFHCEQMHGSISRPLYAGFIPRIYLENALYVTVTLNDEFVERDNFETTVLKDGDVVEFLYFMGGGAR